MRLPAQAWPITLTALLAAAPLHSQSAADDSAEIRTAGTARRNVRPDLATLTLHLHAVDSTPHLAGARLARRADSVRRAMVAIGIPRDSLLNGNQWYWWPGRLEILSQSRCVPARDPRYGCVHVVDTTYRAREAIEVRIRDLGLIGAVIDTALRFRITEISPVRFSATDIMDVQSDALREATVRARQQAELIATASGGRLGRILLLSTVPEYTERYGVSGGIAAGVVSGADATQGTEITAPSITVSATVHGRWRLENRP